MILLRYALIALSLYLAIIAAEKNDLEAVFSWLTLLGIVLSSRPRKGVRD